MHSLLAMKNSDAGNHCTAINADTSQIQQMQLELLNVSLTLDKQPVVRNISLVLPSRGVTAVMGFNGAGKSMLLKIMHGIVQPERGQVLWNGEPGNTAYQLAQAMVFQKPVLLRRSVKANIDFILKHRGQLDVAVRNNLLTSVGLLDKASQPARLLSGGEQQRLALARALACNPRVLFLDEATASLDPASTAIIEKIVAAQAESGTKIIMVTHDAGQASRLSSDIVFMHNGQLTEQTPADAFFNQPSSAAASAYLEGRLYDQQ